MFSWADGKRGDLGKQRGREARVKDRVHALGEEKENGSVLLSPCSASHPALCREGGVGVGGGA